MIFQFVTRYTINCRSFRVKRVILRFVYPPLSLMRLSSSYELKVSAFPLISPLEWFVAFAALMQSRNSNKRSMGHWNFCSIVANFASGTRRSRFNSASNFHTHDGPYRFQQIKIEDWDRTWKFNISVPSSYGYIVRWNCGWTIDWIRSLFVASPLPAIKTASIKNAADVGTCLRLWIDGSRQAKRFRTAVPKSCYVSTMRTMTLRANAFVVAPLSHSRVIFLQGSLLAGNPATTAEGQTSYNALLQRSRSKRNERAAGSSSVS